MNIGVGKVRIGVRDQERARDFWVNTMGCSLGKDEAYGDERWIEVALDDSAVLILALDADGPDDAPDGQPNTALFLSCDDVDDAWKTLSGRGVEFLTEPTDMPFGRWALIEDPEGNRIPLIAPND